MITETTTTEQPQSTTTSARLVFVGKIVNGVVSFQADPSFAPELVIVTEPLAPVLEEALATQIRRNDEVIRTNKATLAAYVPFSKLDEETDDERGHRQYMRALEDEGLPASFGDRYYPTPLGFTTDW